MLVLGDNLIYGNSLTSSLISAKNQLTNIQRRYLDVFQIIQICLELYNLIKKSN